MKSIFLSITILFFSKVNLIAQSKHKQEIQIATQNILFGGFVSGLGSGFNKEDGEKFSKAFFRGFKWGTLGGLGMYAGKKLTYQINSKNELLYGWGSKFIHSAGISIIQNTANGEEPFNKWHTNFGFLRFEVDVTSKPKMQLRIMPVSLAVFTYASFMSSLDLKKTFLFGTPIFQTDPSFFNNSLGANTANAIHIPDNLREQTNYVLAHENIHTLQFNEYLTINMFFKKPVSRIKSKFNKTDLSKILDKYIYLDIPYIRVPYLLLRGSTNCYYRNPFEKEAEHFATNSFVKNCW